MNFKPRRLAKALKAIFKMATALCVITGLILAPDAVLLSYAARQAVVDVDVGIQGITFITDLAASGGTAAGSVNLSWTEPQHQGTTPPYSYIVHVSSAGEITDRNAFNSTQPLSAFSSSSVPTPGPGGGQAAFTVTGLVPGVNYCFAIEEQDSHPFQPNNGGWARAGPWNPGNCAVATTPIATPSGLAAKAGLSESFVSWQALSSTQTGASDLAYYDLYRSTTSGTNFISVATSTALSYTDYPLVPFTTYYYEISAVTTGDSQSALSSQVSVLPFTEVPMEPAGISVVPSSITASISWSPVTRFTDGTIFASTASPTVNELEGYQILRSTQSCTPNFVFLSSETVAGTSFSDSTNGNLYYYQIKAYNSLGVSTETFSISSLGTENYFLSDCVSEVVLTPSQTQSLRSATNGLGGDVVISRNLRPEDINSNNPNILNSVQFIPLLNGVKPIEGFSFSQPVQVIVRYNTDSNGNPTPSGVNTNSSSDTNLGMYWYNGSQYVKMYGTVDAFDQTVTIKSPNLGIYQVRQEARSTNGPVFDISNISGRIITPNGDGKNDVFIMRYDPGPDDVTPTGRIYDLRGGYVSDMTPGLDPNTITWNGTMHGVPVTSGVYVYQIKGGGKTFNGTIVVAK